MNTKKFYMSLGSMVYYVKQVDDEALRNKMLEKLRLIEESIKQDED